MHSPMNSPAPSPSHDEHEARMLYQRLLEGWNQRSAGAMAELFADDGELIGFDGSQLLSRQEIASHLEGVFSEHLTPPYIGKVKHARLLSADVAVLRAIAGMTLPGQTDLEPSLNTHHTLIAVRRENRWRIALFQNTPAQFHGRPDLTRQFTDELRPLLS